MAVPGNMELEPTAAHIPVARRIGISGPARNELFHCSGLQFARFLAIELGATHLPGSRVRPAHRTVFQKCLFWRSGLK